MPRSRSLHAGVGALIASAALVLPGCTNDPVPAPPAQVRSICDAYALGGAGARGTRVFVVQPKTEPEGRVSYEAFRGSIDRLIEEQVRPCLAADRPNLIVFPEDLGLPAAFVGTRAAEARSKDNAAGAFIALLGPYLPGLERRRRRHVRPGETRRRRRRRAQLSIRAGDRGGGRREGRHCLGGHAGGAEADSCGGGGSVASARKRTISGAVTRPRSHPIAARAPACARSRGPDRGSSRASWDP